VIQLKMTEPYYNLSEHGPGMEGFVNYANVLVNGWLSILFILFIWLATIYVGSKSEWKMSGVMSFAFLLCLISSAILSLFTVVNEILVFIIIFGLGASIFWMVIER